MRGKVTQAIAVFLVLAVTEAGTAYADDVDDYVEAEIKAQRIPGLSLAVLKDGKTIKAKGYGLANLEVDAKAAPETVYELASVTKQFTATAIMILVNEKKLTLDDRLSKYVPDLPKTWEGIMIRHLLNHTSGVNNHTEMKVILDDESKEYTRAEMLAFIAKAPVKFKPGEDWAYNDSGYFLLALVVEKASGQSYETFLTDRIFKPLEMTVTRSNVSDEIVQHRASGYVWRDGQFRRARPVSPNQSLGGGHLRSSIQDLAKWDAALHGEKLLPRHLLEQMWTPGKLNNGRTVPSYLADLKDSSYGFGWLLGDLKGHRFVEHAGVISSGYTSNILRFLDDRLTVIVLTNRSVFGTDNPFDSEAPRPWDIAKGVAKYYIQDLRARYYIQDLREPVTALNHPLQLTRPHIGSCAALPSDAGRAAERGRSAARLASRREHCSIAATKSSTLPPCATVIGKTLERILTNVDCKVLIFLCQSCKRTQC